MLTLAGFRPSALPGGGMAATQFIKPVHRDGQEKRSLRVVRHTFPIHF
jgi:hypothetical protein